MENEQLRREFINEVWRRYEEVQNWAIANWPDPARPISSSDFVEARKEILALGMTQTESNQQAPEPEQGGPQYIEVTPAPWP